ncbi:GDSL-type esterase/lipase family protein [Lacinutrix neustonica]|uniref:GDSL-type esterase/lipase family protein n=1 Tax=Lacinutrix neustonica TaxID=2980107 RepID=A0A9E8MYM9_9FLAO|nr:GDSL-type esterase/lipase family protein [Lacinutrix neustonica]WAC03791.1 GDSL-type esterase/lipase family protein [Lacinutrix neustonica]
MKQTKFKIISIIIGLVFSAFLGEFLARVYFFGPAAFSYSRTNSFGILDNFGLLKYSDSDELKYELLPNLDTKYKLADFHTNAEGFRDRNHEVNATTTKIAVLGDSFTMGTGVSQDEMYVTQTEKALNKQDARTTYEVFNFGVYGFALTNYKTILDRNVLKHRPDLVVIGFCASNDHYEPGTDFSIDDFTIKPKKNVLRDSYLKKLLQVKLNAQEHKPVTYEPYHVLYIDKQFQKFQNTLEQLHTKGLIFYMDLVYDPTRIAQIKDLAQKNGLLFLDVSEFFYGKNLPKYIVNELDPHPNGKANQIFANKLSSYILANRNEIFNK